MAILGGWWQDRLLSRRLNKLIAATQYFLIAAWIRVNGVLSNIIWPHQHGFMAQKRIQEPLMLATHLIQEANYNHKSLQLVSFDIEKAFDRVIHIIIRALRAFGIPQITIMAIQHYFLSGFAYVEVNGKKGLLITVRTGSGQGDPVSSILFLLATEPLN